MADFNETAPISDTYPFRGHSIRQSEQVYVDLKHPDFGVSLGPRDWMNVEYIRPRGEPLVKLSFIAFIASNLPREQVGEVTLEQGEEHRVNRIKYPFSGYVSEDHLNVIMDEGHPRVTIEDHRSTNGSRLWFRNVGPDFDDGRSPFTGRQRQHARPDPFESPYHARYEEPYKSPKEEQPYSRKEKPQSTPTSAELLMIKYGEKYRTLGVIEFSICEIAIADILQRYGTNRKALQRQVFRRAHPDRNELSLPEASRNEAYLFIQERLGF